VYNNLLGISESTSISFSDYLRRYEVEGRKLVKMQTGDPYFETHPAIIQAAERALTAGQTKYCDSRGLMSLREAIAEKLKQKNGIEADPSSQILVTHGAVHGLSMLIRTIVGPGDEVVLLEPFWRAYQADVVLAGGRAIIVRLDRDRGFQLDVEKVLAVLSPRTRAIIINSPNNPSGAVYRDGEIRKLACIAAERGIVLISDEVYESILFGSHRHYSPGSDPAVAKWVATVFSFSKTHSMTGWRVGYLVASEEIIDQLLKLSQFSVTSLAPFSQIAALAALKDHRAEIYAQEMQAAYVSRRNRLSLEVMDTWLQHAMVLPEGTFYTLLDCHRFDRKSTELAKYIVDHWGVAFTPGIAFGDAMDGYLRMCFATSEENISKALNALRELGAAAGH
jgi:aspartate/methionine/tyrosine aminotransferase